MILSQIKNVGKPTFKFVIILHLILPFTHITIYSIFDSEKEAEEEKKRMESTIDNSLEEELKIDKDVKNYLYANIIRDLNTDFFKVREDDYGITEEYYPRLLNKMSELARELKLTNSLELSNLFTYLLWNGYLSKTKQNVYRIEKRKLIEGLIFADIMDGASVCINHADMLKDFLNTCGYNSSMLINLIDKNTRSNYRLDIERKIEKSKKGTEFFHFAMSPIIRKIGNHAFTLIEDNNQLYIYDSTNLILLKVTDPYTAEVINGQGTYKLNPYLSYAFNNKEKNDAISKLFTLIDFSSPYNRKDFIITSEENMETFRQNNFLVEDFYDDISSDLLSISEATDKIKSRKKQRTKN